MNWIKADIVPAEWPIEGHNPPCAQVQIVQHQGDHHKAEGHPIHHAPSILPKAVKSLAFGLVKWA